MRKLNALLAATLFIAAPSAFAQVSDAASQTLSLNIEPYANIELADAALDFSVDQSVTNEAAASTTYDVSTTGAVDDGNPVNGAEAQKITGVLDADVSTGTLSVVLGAPDGATSTGSQGLSSEAVDLVTDIGSVAAAGLTMDYLYVVPEGSAASSQDVEVTYTITDA